MRVCSKRRCKAGAAKFSRFQSSNGQIGTERATNIRAGIMQKGSVARMSGATCGTADPDIAPLIRATLAGGCAVFGRFVFGKAHVNLGDKQHAHL
jgi:hypothetical protein